VTIHLGRRASREGWVSFESDPHLSRTKERLYGRCLPCLTSLLEQLKHGEGVVRLEQAWSCWKVVAVLGERDECLDLLARFEEAYPDEYVYGKLGTGKGRETFALMFHTEDETRRDELAVMLRNVVRCHFPGRHVFHSRGCGDPYELLLGPWQTWQEVCEIRHPERIRAVRSSLRESLYGKV
jgi:hypothetical protein